MRRFLFISILLLFINIYSQSAYSGSPRLHYFASPTLSLADSTGFFKAIFVNDTVSAALITIRNTGTSDGIVSGVSSSNSAFTITYPSFPQTVESDSSVTFTVKFSPKITGDISGTMTFTTSDTANPELEFEVNGIGSLHNAGTLGFVEYQKDDTLGINGLDGALDIAVSPDGAFLYVTGNIDDAIAVFSVNDTTGSLTFIEILKDGVAGVDGLDGAYGIEISPDGKFVYACGEYDDAVAVFSRNSATGVLTFIEFQKDGIAGVDGMDRSCNITMSPDGSHLYITGYDDDAVAVFNRNSATGALTFVEMEKDGVGGVDGLDGAWGITVSKDGNFVYATGDIDDAIAVFSRNSISGELSFIEVQKDGVGGVDGLNGATGIEFSPNCDFIYATGRDDDAIATFSRNAATGMLSFVEYKKDNTDGIDGLDLAQYVSVNSDGSYIYVCGQNDNAVAVFRRNSMTGLLTFVEIQKDGINGVEGMNGSVGLTINPKGKHIFIAGLTDDAVSIFSIEQFSSSLTANPDSLEFDTVNVGKSDTLSVNLKNIGATNLFITSTVTPDEYMIDPTNFTLDEGDSTDITVIFTPPDSGSYADSIYFYSNDSLSNVLSYYVTGYGFKRPYISVSPLSFNFDTTMVGFFSFKFISIENSGNDSLRIYNIASTQDVVSVPDFADTTVIPPFDSLSFKLKYRPDTLASFGGSILITSSDPDEPSIILGYECLAKAAEHAVITIADSLTELDFDSVSLGSNKQLSLTVINNGTTYLDVYNIAPPDGFSTDSTSFNDISPGDSATFSITFDPDTLGLYSDSLSIVNNDPTDTLVKIGLTGFSMGPFITSDTSHFTFDSISVYSRDTMVIYIMNTGNDDLDISSASAPEPFSISPSSESGISPGDSASFTVIFSPESLGTISDTISFSSNDYQMPSYNLIAEGVSLQLVQTISISPVSIDFGSVKINRSDSSVVTLSNAGDSTYTVDSLFVPDQFNLNIEAPFSLGSGSEKEVTIKFCPTDTGFHSGRITLFSFAVDTNYIFIDLTGYGSNATEPVLNINPLFLNFGSVTACDSTYLYLSTKNMGNEELSISNISTLTEEFTVEGYAVQISPGDSFNVGIWFQPPDSGYYTDTLTLNSSDPDKPIVKVPMTGIGRQDTTLPELVTLPEITYRDTASVTIAFRTDEYADTWIYYNADSLYDSGTYLIKNDTSKVRFHTIHLDSLDSGTRYKYHIAAFDKWQNGPVESLEYEFVTLDIPDTSPPVILGKPVAQEIDTGSVMITWVTNELSNSTVQFTLKGLQNDTLTSSNESTVNEHFITITGLDKDTLYYFRVSSNDQSGNGPSFSSVDSFKTTSAPDITPPKIIYGPVVIGLNHETAVIKLKTNENTTASINYDTSRTYAFSVSNSNTRITHTIRLSGLKASTKYYFNIEASDLAGNTYTYPPGEIIDLSFTTSPAPATQDSTPPSIIIGPVEQNLNPTRFTVYWKTNVLTDAAVEYGLTTELDKYLNTTDSDIDHKLILSDLLPDTTYYYRVISRGENEQGVISSIFDVRTPVEADTFAPVIIEGPALEFIGTDKAVIVWKTDKTSSSRIDYSLDSLSFSQYQISDQISGVADHRMQLTELSADTVYFFHVRSVSENTKNITSSLYSFRTLSAADTIAPSVISGPDPVSVTENSATIEWITDEPSTSMIEYGLKTSAAKNYTDSYWVESDASGNTIHRAQLTGLLPGREYDFRIENRDLSTNLNTSYSRNKTFSTSAGLDTLPPVIIKGPEVYWTDKTVSFVWETDEICEMYVMLRPKISGKKFMKYGWWKKVRKHTFTITNLLAGQEYEYKLVSRDMNGNTTTWPEGSDGSSLAKSSELKKADQPPGGDGSFFTDEDPDTQVPVIIEGPTVVSKTSNSVTVQWKTDERSDSYIVYGMDENYGSEKSDASDVTEHSMTLTNLAAGTVYNFKINSTDPSGNGPVSSANSAVKTESEDDISPPEIISGPTAESISDDQASIIWETDEPSDSRVEFGISIDLGSSRLSTGDVTNHSMVLTNLTPGITYYYLVRSSDIDDNGPVSSAIDSFMTATSPDLTPPVISSVAVSAVSDKTAAISFKTDELGDTFVNYGLDTSYGNSAANSNDVTQHSITITNLIPDTLYYYKVGSIDKSGNETEYSNGLSFRTDASADNISPAKPQNLSGMQGSNQAVIWWDRNSEEDLGGYNLYRKISTGSYRMIASMVTDTFYFDRGLENTVQYWYKITAVDRAIPYNESDESELLGLNPLSIFDIEAPATSYPTDGQRIPNDEAVLKIANSDLPYLRETVTYEFVLAEESDFYNQIASILDLKEGDPLTEWDPGLILEHDRTYYWKARAYDGFFHSPWTSAMSFIADSTASTGVSNELPGGIKIPEEFELYQNYPNPFNPETNIKFALPKPGKVVIRIYNVLGQQVTTLLNGYMMPGYHRIRWNATNSRGIKVSGGLYIYRIIFDGRSVSKKMVLIK